MLQGDKGSILQYFQSSLSYQLLLRSLFCLFLSGFITQVLLNMAIALQFTTVFVIYIFLSSEKSDLGVSCLPRHFKQAATCCVRNFITLLISE